MFAKRRLSLGIHLVWSVFAARIKKARVLSYKLSAQRRLTTWQMPRQIWYFAWRTSILSFLSCGDSYKTEDIMGYVTRSQWTATWENVPSDMCTQRRLKWACASVQSDKSLHCPDEVLYHWLVNVTCVDSDQTARLRRLIWIFVMSTFSLKLRFLALRLKLLKWTRLQ